MIFGLLCGTPVGGCINCCTQSVCPSLCLSVLCIRFTNNWCVIKTSTLVETWHWTRVTRTANLRSKGQRSRSLGTKTQNRFCAYLCQKCIDVRSQLSLAHFRIHFTSENASFCDIRPSVCLWRTSHIFRSLTMYLERPSSYFAGRLLLAIINDKFNFEIKRSLGTIMQELCCTYLREFDLHQTDTKMILGPFLTYCQIHFTSGNAYFLRYLCVFWKSFFLQVQKRSATFQSSLANRYYEIYPIAPLPKIGGRSWRFFARRRRRFW